MTREDAGGAVELDADCLREVCLESGADDVGFTMLTAPGLESERDYVCEALPGTRTLIAYCVRQSRDNLRSRAASAGNTDHDVMIPMVDKIGHRISLAVQDRGARALFPAIAFPMEVHRLPARGWVVSHKLAAVAAGLGHMGVHRNLIHPRFGSFVLLGTVLTDAVVNRYSQPLDWNPCLGCNLCVAACPVGAIHPDGDFDFASCLTHNYSHFLMNFNDWVEDAASSTDAADYRSRYSQGETVARWQSLANYPQYRAGYCVAVCPAGEEVIGPYLADRKKHLKDVVKPLQRKPEYVYVTPDSNAEHHVRRRFPSKVPRYVESTLRAPDGVDLAPEPDRTEGDR